MKKEMELNKILLLIGISLNDRRLVKWQMREKQMKPEKSTNKSNKTIQFIGQMY